jgi:hypothetical protein
MIILMFANYKESFSLNLQKIIIQGEEDGDVELEIPAFYTEEKKSTWQDIPGTKPGSIAGHYGGVILQTSSSASRILEIMFPRIQIQLRKNCFRR